ncbi:hypothetical protein UFOVP410_137 [uncultured Caudovirales phage]|uniref:Uncharacterized protein n=1 Tax=uncultured Caudovirales phage TaxID=2100421 RepID=A0A6J5M3V9_9CAUD|nr:hypothetical protein UFOVP410_137 [uncultured Caudovirales phage]
MNNKYLHSLDLWCYIDEQTQKLDLLMEDPIAASTEAYKMFVLGQKEMLSRLVDYLHQNEFELESKD